MAVLLTVAACAAAACGAEQNPNADETSTSTVATTAPSVPATAFATATTSPPPPPTPMPPGSTRPSGPPISLPQAYDIAIGPRPPCRNDVTPPARPLKSTPIGDVNGDGKSDRVIVEVRRDGTRYMHDLYIDYGNAATGPLGTSDGNPIEEPQEIIGAVDLDNDKPAELIVRLDSNQVLLAVARIGGCTMTIAHKPNGELFSGNPEILGHGCCPYQFAQFDCAERPGGIDIITSYSYPSKPDGTFVSAFDSEMNARDPAAMTYTATRERWRYDGGTMHLVTREKWIDVGHALDPDLLASGLDCAGMTISG